MEKVCNKCGETKLLSEYYSDKSRPDGKRANCKACHNKSLKKSKSKDSFKANRNARERRQRKEKHSLAVRHNYRIALRDALESQGLKKEYAFEKYLGCTMDEFRKWIDQHKEPWMTDENRGLYNGAYGFGWDFDHWVPLSSFDLTNEEELKKAFHYTNYRPMDSWVNRDIKGDRLDFTIEELKSISNKYLNS